jgi:hypothetical protein
MVKKLTDKKEKELEKIVEKEDKAKLLVEE